MPTTLRGLVENSTINASVGTFGIEITGTNNSSTGTLIAEGNTVYGEIAGNESGAAINVGGNAEALDNTVYNSNIGISVDGSGSLAVGNTVYNDTTGAGVGIEVETGGTAQGNTVYGSTYGMIDDGSNTVIENNTLYGNTTGIQVGQYTLSSGHVINNNTIVQSSGVALNLYSGNATNTTFLDNILSLTNAIGIVAPQAAQVGFVSDYNLYYLQGSATVATWSGQSIATVDGFKTEVAQDEDSFAANPQFVNPAANNYTLQNTSPAIDRGDPALQYFLEPTSSVNGDGDRIDIGAQGGTAQANPSPAQIVQLLGSTGGQAYQVGQSTTIDFRSAGLTALEPILFINAGGGTVAGTPSWNAWQANEFTTTSGSQSTNSTTVNASGLTVPQAVLQNYLTFSSTANYAIPVAAGTYQVSLVFEEPYYTAAGQREFNIIANGVTEATDFDIFKTAGGGNKAIAVTFDVTTGTTGLALELQAVVGAPLLTGIEISRINPTPPTFTASAEVSYNGGNTWATIATGLTLDQYGAGSFTFTPTQATTTGLLQIVASNGVQTVSDTSLGTFSVAPAGNEFYISATGSNSNSGKSPSAPMASLAALLNIYTLEPGDIINVGAGTCTLPAAIVLGAADSGSPGDPIQIIGQGATTIFQSASNASTSSVFEFDGAHDVTIENLAIAGGGTGVNILANTGGSDISLQGLNISGFSNMGIDVGAGATNFSITGSDIHDPLTARSYDGIDIDTSANATIDNNTFLNLRYGVNVTSQVSLTIDNNTFTTDNEGVNINIDGSTIIGLTVDDNTVTSPTGTGLYIDLPYNGPGIVFIEGNMVSGSPYDGIYEFGDALISGNTLTNNAVGIETSTGDTSVGVSTVTGNTITGSTTYGIEIDYQGALVSGNTISSSVIGIYNISTAGLIKNNLLVNNTSIAIQNNSTASIFNDTIVQAGGIAIEQTTTNPIDIENNIFQMTGGAVFSVAAADQGASHRTSICSTCCPARRWRPGPDSVPDFNSWMLETGFDIDSLTGNPQFTNPAGGNYYLLPTSPGIDAGDPAFSYSLEPGSNGGRINLGMEGDTSSATQSAALTVQVTSPTGLAKLQDGVPTTISYSTSGVSGLEIVTQENLGGPAITGANAEGDFVSVASGTGYNITTTTATINMSGVSGTAPAQVYQSEIYAASGVGQKLIVPIAAADGTYQITLNFAEQSNVGVGGRVFNVKINGVTVAPNFDVYKTAGSQIDKAVNETFTVTASGGSGITIELDKLTSNPAILSGIEVDKVTATAASQTATVQASPDGGATWETVATAAPIDAYGNSSVSWTPNFTTTGNTALVRVTVNGVTGVSQAFLVTNSGNDFYINSSASSGGQYTTAPGSDLNSGKITQCADGRSHGLAALLHSCPGRRRLYRHRDLPDAHRRHPRRVGFRGHVPGPDHRCCNTQPRKPQRQRFPVHRGAKRHHRQSYADRRERWNSAQRQCQQQQCYGLQCHSREQRELRHLCRRGEQQFHSRRIGDFRFRQQRARLRRLFQPRIRHARYCNDHQQSDIRPVRSDLRFARRRPDSGQQHPRQHRLWALSAGLQRRRRSGSDRYRKQCLQQRQFEHRQLWHLRVWRERDVTGNAIYGQTASGDIGIELTQYAIATGNTIYDNYDGVFLGDSTVTVTGNRIFVNSNAGCRVQSSGGTIEDNDIYSNGTGILATGIGSGSYVNIQNNLIYANTVTALNLSGGGGGPGNSIIGNTIWQSVGTSISLSGSAVNTTIADNIIWGDEGTILSIASNSTWAAGAL